MKLYSQNHEIINAIYQDLKENDIIVKRVINEDNRAGDMGSYIDLATVSITAIATIISYLSYKHLTNEKHYIHLKYKDGMELKLANLSEEEKKEKLAKLKGTWNNLVYIGIG